MITKNQFYLYDTLNNNLRLTRINKVPITRNLRLKAFKHAEEKWRLGEDAKRMAEEEERKKEEEAEREVPRGLLIVLVMTVECWTCDYCN